MFNLFGSKEKELKEINLGQVDVFIELYTGKVITLTLKGTYDEVFECYSPVMQQLKYFLEKVDKNNLLEISKGYRLNIRQEIKSVLVGEIQDFKITV